MGSIRRNDSSSNAFDSQPTRRSDSKCRFRVVMRRKARPPEVIWITGGREYACSIAEQLNELIPGEPARVEQWKRGKWFAIPITDTQLPRIASSQQSNWHQAPKSGEMARAVLLAQRTRRGGWRAWLPEYGLEGHITNSESIPSTISTGDMVQLRVGAANRDGTHLQLAWPQ